MRKAVTFLVLMILILIYFISISSFHKILVQSNTSIVVEDKVKEYNIQLKNPNVCYLNFPLCIMRYTPEVATMISSIVENTFPPDLVEPLAPVTIEYSHVLTILTWLLVGYFVVEIGIVILFKLTYYFIILAVVLFVGYLLILQHCKDKNFYDLDGI